MESVRNVGILKVYIKYILVHMTLSDIRMFEISTIEVILKSII